MQVIWVVCPRCKGMGCGTCHQKGILPKEVAARAEWLDSYNLAEQAAHKRGLHRFKK